MEKSNNNTSGNIVNSAALAIYTIDEQDPPLSVNLSLSFDIFHNQLIFNTPKFSPGQHKLEVTYVGNGENTAQYLMLNYFVQFYATVKIWGLEDYTDSLSQLLSR